MFDLGIENVTRFESICYYGPIWLVEFRDWTKIIAIEDEWDSPEENYILTEVSELAGIRVAACFSKRKQK